MIANLASNKRALMGALFMGAFVIGSAQTSVLTIDEALKLAKDRNGTIRAAAYAVETARSRVRQSFGAFLPTLTPTYRYSDQRQESSTGGTGAFSSKTSRTEVEAAWTILDSGQRLFAYNGNRRDQEAEILSLIQTLRETLFNVHQQYLEALRAAELMKIADAQVERAQKILDQTKAQVELKVAPKKDILQAEADLLNAKFQQLTARNRSKTTTATLRATIGWDASQPFPELQAFAGDRFETQLPPLEQLLREGVEARADLESQRKRLEAQRFDVQAAERRALVNWSLDASYTKGWAPTGYNNRLLSFNVSLPLFDGSQTRESARQAKLGVEAGEARLTQAERTARSEIESEYLTVVSDSQKVEAAKLALRAAQLNYKAAQESFAAGAEGTSIVVVLTAQVSLVTAESNYVEAVYDYAISDVRLRLLTGKPVPGEG